MVLMLDKRTETRTETRTSLAVWARGFLGTLVTSPSLVQARLDDECDQTDLEVDAMSSLRGAWRQ